MAIEYESEISHMDTFGAFICINYGNFLLGNMGRYGIKNNCYYVLLFLCDLLPYIMVNILEEAKEGNQKE